ncbi:MAG: hypothetical protein ACYC1M_09570 [Armatimonadota bacterium]
MKNEMGVMSIMGFKLYKLHCIHLDDRKTDTQADDIDALLKIYSESGLERMVINFMLQQPE